MERWTWAPAEWANIERLAGEHREARALHRPSRPLPGIGTYYADEKARRTAETLRAVARAATMDDYWQARGVVSD